MRCQGGFRVWSTNIKHKLQEYAHYWFESIKIFSYVFAWQNRWRWISMAKGVWLRVVCHNTPLVWWCLSSCTKQWWHHPQSSADQNQKSRSIANLIILFWSADVCRWRNREFNNQYSLQVCLTPNSWNYCVPTQLFCANYTDSNQ